MYERFTDRARKVMQLANQEAKRLNHEYIGTEHILLGLVNEGSGVAAHALKNLDIDLRKIRLEIEKFVQLGPDIVTMRRLPQSPRAKKAIEYSSEEAHSLNHNYVGTEHLLLGLLRVEEGVGAQVLVNLGLKLEGVREEVQNLLGDRLEESQEVTKSGKVGEGIVLKEYDLYLPLQYSDGSPVETKKIEHINNQLRDKFGGLSYFSQKAQGSWKLHHVTFREDMVILRVLAGEQDRPREFLLRLKNELMSDRRQEDILIVEREVKVF